MFDSVDVDFIGRATLGLYHRHIATEAGGLEAIPSQESLVKTMFVYTDADYLQLKELNLNTLNLDGLRANKSLDRKSVV